MKKLLLLFFGLCIGMYSNAQDLKTYKIYDASAKEVSFQQMHDSLSGYDVVFFGEFHDNALIHWLQLKTTQRLFERNHSLVLGAEMFEADNQLILDEYLQDKISQERFEEEMRLWNNYKTDYKPLVEFAKAKNLKFIATNVPRRYASVASKFGLDSLETYSRSAKNYFAKLPIKVDTITPGYAEMLKMMGSHGMDGRAMNFVAAQALKDATMAQKIAENLDEDLFLHYNGDYHSRAFGGIYWYLKKLRPNIKAAVITVKQSDSDTLSLENGEIKMGNFTIVVPQDFTKTY